MPSHPFFLSGFVFLNWELCSDLHCSVCGCLAFLTWTNMLHHISFPRLPCPLRVQTCVQLHSPLELLALAFPGLPHSSGSSSEFLFWVLVFYCWETNYQKLNGFKLFPCILGKQKFKIKVLERELEALGNSISLHFLASRSHLSSLAYVTSLQLQSFC